MPFLAPLALISLVILGPLIVAMYLLRLRREERVVSSTLLWRKMVRDVEANAPWQKLRRNLLLLLQLLLLLLLAFALARPFAQTTGIAGRNLIIILDRSASMAATDAAPTRLDAAKQQAITLIDQLPDGGRATVIAAGGEIDVPASAATDRRQLRDAINSVQQRNGGTSDLSQALTLAAALAQREPESEIAIISDGNVQIPPDVQVPATVRYFPIGSASTNVAISAMSLQTSAAGQTLFVQATNYGQEETSRRVDLYLDGQLFNAYALTIPAGQDRSVVVDVAANVQTAEARLQTDTGPDTQPADDTGWAVNASGDGTQVRVVSGGNRFLSTALTLLPSVRATVVPTTTATFAESAAEIPVTILDGVVPDPLPPGNLLFIGPVRSSEFFSVTGEVDFPAVRPAPGEDPLLRNVSLSDVSVLRAAQIVPGPWARTVADSDGGPLLIAGERDGRRVVVLSFRLQNSNLPLQIAFPLLLSNVISYLAPGSGIDAAQLAPGQPLAVPVDTAVTAVRLTLPDGQQRDLTVANGQAIFAETDALGIYTVEQFQNERLVGRRRYAVNLFAPTESRIAPQTNINVPQTSGLPQAVTGERVGRNELWRLLAAIALVVLVIEWLVYQRNSLPALRDRWRARRNTTANT